MRRTPLTPARWRDGTVSRVQKVNRPRRDTGPTRAQRDDVLWRCDGRCEVCGKPLWVYGQGWVDVHSFHHRQPRGMGGSTVETNGPERLLLLCGDATSPGGCHQMVESQRALAYANGWLVRRPTDPATVPVELWHGRRLLTTDGRYEEAS